MQADTLPPQSDTAPPTTHEEVETPQEMASDAIVDSVSLLYDYSADGTMLQHLKEKLAEAKNGQRLVRIAFCGDSFIEGDIFTGPLRSQLQAYYGGGGVGWLPMSSQVAGFRNTVRHTFGGWVDHSIVNDTKHAYALAGHVFAAQGAAWANYVLPAKNSYDMASIYYVADSTINVKVNGDEAEMSLPPTEGHMAQHDLKQAGSRLKLSFDAHAGAAGRFYGVALDQKSGVQVDNYSLRGNAGYRLLSMNSTMASDFARLRSTDLVVLQYGLNVANEKQKDYGAYVKQMKRMIARIRAIYPSSAIMIMGVSDRAGRSNDGSLRTIPGVLYLALAQRQLAQEEGLLYWDTLKAMGGPGSMIKFEEKGMAAKDYTHLGAAGGRVLAKKFAQSLIR